ncbi:MAG: AAA family ATPase [Phycisphaerales bacterium]|nr:AAA family ATPase [Phycisphaerales bacterium]
MRVASIHLSNFKRFTDLEISQIPSSAKLVVVVGPNGCGKSSLFDALLNWYRTKVGFGANQDPAYYRKNLEEEFDWGRTVSVMLHNSAAPTKGCLYVRTAYRNDPDFSVDRISRPSIPSEEVRVSRAIDNDQAVSDKYRRLVYETMAGVYSEENDSKTVRDFREELIGSIRNSMKAVFGDLSLNSVANPLESGAFFFEKGTSKAYHYKNLSGGEKAAFDLILDLHIKRRYFQDAIYCVDELDVHLHTKVQGSLLKEMVAILPANSQLWVTTHSLGVLRAAQDLMALNPAEVCVIDFDDVDPDIPRTIIPSSIGRVAWQKLLSIALDDLSKNLAPKFLVVCEGSSIGTRRKDFDAEIYNRVLGAHHPEVVFVSGGSAKEVATNGISIRGVFSKLLPGVKVFALVDRDDRSAREVESLESDHCIVLGLRNLESYIFADDVIEALVVATKKGDLREQALQAKREALAESASRGHAGDDLKSAAGTIFTKLRSLLSLQRCGNSTDAFMQDTLAPLIVPEMQTYFELKAAIIDKLK